MKRILNNIIFGLATLLMLVSCSSQWAGIGEKPEKLPKLKDKVFIEKMDSLHSLRPDYFYSKIKVTYADNERKISFKSSVNIVLDSALSTILSYAAIPVFTAYLDTSEITIVNKKEKCFTEKKISDYSELWGIELSFDNIQELLFGLPIGYVKGEKYHVISNPYEYVLSTHNKRELKKSEKRHKSNIIYTYKLNQNATNLYSAHIYSPADTFKIDIAYTSWQEKNGTLYPKEMNVTLSGPKTSSEIKLVFNKLKIDIPRNLTSIIPENYEECN